jgi:serine/threonine protein phosphatase PrpC
VLGVEICTSPFFSVLNFHGFVVLCSPIDALAEAFVRSDTAFREELIAHQKSKRIIQKDWHPGCTAVTALIVRNKLFVANAGDCRAILSRAGKPFPVTRVGINSLFFSHSTN